MGTSEAAERAKKKAHEYEKLYSGCAQSVLGALQEEFGIGNKESFKAASALAGGIARQGETCGAIIGALSALGLVIGREKIEDTPVYKATMDSAVKMIVTFREEMKKQFGLRSELQNTLCRHIQETIYGRSFDLANKEEFQAFLDTGGHGDTGCPKVCGIAVQVVAEEISRMQEKPDEA
ncbi:C-GCAxxG-C-C family protein [Chloroflexota bacterium]